VSDAAGVMTAAVLRAAGSWRAVRAALPEPAAGEVLVRIEGCGVCASSLPLWQGRPWFDYPLEPGAPGHEAWGVVERVGDGVEAPEPGERVALLSYHGFADYDVAPAERCVPLPPALDGLPVPLEAFGCGVAVLRRADVRAGATVAVVGMGFLGRTVAALAARAGADVVPVGRGEQPRGRFERVIECAGTQGALDTASGLVAERGRLVLAGYHQDGPRTVDVQGWNWRGIDVVNAHERDPAAAVAAMRAAAALLAAGELDLPRLVTHRFPLDRLGDAFAAAATRPPGFVKAWAAP
jgi:threonine dehydrogenase-like Zn-dependent dehydrogenase